MDPIWRPFFWSEAGVWARGMKRWWGESTSVWFLKFLNFSVILKCVLINNFKVLTTIIIIVFESWSTYSKLLFRILPTSVYIVVLSMMLCQFCRSHNGGHYNWNVLRFLPNYKIPQGMFYTHLMSTTLASALDIGLRLFGSNRKLVPELSSWGNIKGLI